MLSNEQQEAFTRYWTEAQPAVSHYIASLVSDAWAARDILQNTSLVLLRKFGEYDSSRPFLAWALGIAKFEVLGYRRDAARSRLVFDSELLESYTQTWAELAPGLGDEAVALKVCLRKLPRRQRELVRLRYFEEWNASEIANHLRMTPVNVRAILKRVRDGLRECVSRQVRIDQMEGGSAT